MDDTPEVPATEPLSEDDSFDTLTMGKGWSMYFEHLNTGSLIIPVKQSEAKTIRRVHNEQINALCDTIRTREAEVLVLREALDNAKKYFDQRADVQRDNPHAPNEEMALWEELNAALSSTIGRRK